jgi:hypothetical protein
MITARLRLDVVTANQRKRRGFLVFPRRPTIETPELAKNDSAAINR